MPQAKSKAPESTFAAVEAAATTIMVTATGSSRTPGVPAGVRGASSSWLLRVEPVSLA